MKRWLLVAVALGVFLPLAASAQGVTDLQQQVTDLLARFTRLEGQLTQFQTTQQQFQQQQLQLMQQTLQAQSQPPQMTIEPSRSGLNGADFITGAFWGASASSYSPPPLDATTSPAHPALARTLARGDSGDDVKNLQTFLIAQGFLKVGSATGFFGPQTEKAVRNFQAHVGVISSGDSHFIEWGVVGPRTLAAIAVTTSGGSFPSAGVTTTSTPATVRNTLMSSTTVATSTTSSTGGLYLICSFGQCVKLTGGGGYTCGSCGAGAPR